MFVYNIYFNTVWIGAIKCESFAVAERKAGERWPDRIGRFDIRLSM